MKIHRINKWDIEVFIENLYFLSQDSSHRDHFVLEFFDYFKDYHTKACFKIIKFENAK